MELAFCRCLAQVLVSAFYITLSLEPLSWTKNDLDRARQLTRVNLRITPLSICAFALFWVRRWERSSGNRTQRWNQGSGKLATWHHCFGPQCTPVPIRIRLGRKWDGTLSSCIALMDRWYYTGAEATWRGADQWWGTLWCKCCTIQFRLSALA